MKAASGAPDDGEDNTVTKAPELRSTKTPRATVIAAVATLVAVVLVVGSWVWSLGGGVAHTATDRTVSAARAKAIPMAEADVERIVTVLAPRMGQPALRAVVDGCDRGTEDYFTNNIGCRRTYYLYFPTTAEPPEASVVAGLLAADAQSTVWYSDNQPGYSSSAGLTRYRSGDAEVESKRADATAYVSCGPARAVETVVVDEGCSEILSAASTGANVLVHYSVAYFSG